MKFLVILICLALNHFWLRNYDRFDDRWFFRFRENIEAAVRRAPRGAAAWWAMLALVYALPLALLLLLLQLAQEQVLGLATMLIHILVVLIAFDRTQPGRLAKDFLQARAEGGGESAAAFLGREFRGARSREFANEEEVAHFFRKHLVYRSFEKMFVQFFWYLAAGPAAVLASYISYQLRDSRDAQTHPESAEVVEIIIHLLEWIPLRLVGLSFSLAGNFEHCFNQLKKSFWEFDRKVDNPGLLYSFAGFALFGAVARDETGTEEAGADASGRDDQAWEIEPLQALLARCQLLWLGVLAVLTMFGPVV